MVFTIENLAFIFQGVGTIFVAYAALRVHHRVLAEHKIDEKVLHTMNIEQVLGWTGFVFLVLGFFMEVGFSFFI